MKTQREMSFFTPIAEPKFAPQKVIDGFSSYREAVIWAWQNRPCHGMSEDMDQSLCARTIGLHAPHFSRCVNPISKAPMNLNPDLLHAFETYTGWHVVTQYQLKIKGMTVMEQVIAERRAA